MQWTKPELISAVMLWCMCCLNGISYGQGRKTNQPDGTPDRNALDFFSSFDLSVEGPYQDADATAAGSQRLRELVQKAQRTINQLNYELDRRREPAIERDTLQGFVNQAQREIVDARTVIVNAQKNIAALDRQIPIIVGDLLRAAQNNRANLVAVIANQEQLIGLRQQVISDRQPRIDALSIAIKPIDDRISQLWSEMEEARKQWLTIREPTVKYARGDFESLRKVLDDWLVIDGLWPQAFLWASLCAYETADYEDAVAYLDKADDIRLNKLGHLQEWPAVLAMRYLIGRKSPPHAKRTGSYIEKARNLNEKDKSPMVYFLIGTSYTERSAEHGRAQNNFEKALELDSKFACAQVALARLQTTSPNETVLEPQAGLATLTKIWTKTGQRSWRLAKYLAEGHARIGEKNKAIEFWKQVIVMATDQDARDQAKDAITSIETGPASTAPPAATTNPTSSAPAGNRQPTSNRQPSTKSQPPTDNQPAQLAARQWTNNKGAKLRASLGKLKVELIKPDGSSAWVEVSDLSPEDIAWIKQHIQ